MIKASELRIGNAIWDETRKQIKWVTHRVISDLASHPSPLPYSPIALTPEWLERCGFEYMEPYYSKEILKLFMNSIRDGSGDYDGFGVMMHVENKKIPLVIRNLHQLQNLYFSLTAEELEIKL